MVRVFVVDDHELIRLALRTLIEGEEDLTLVGEAATATEALARVPPTRPDVAIVDLHLEEGDGVQVCRELHARHPEVRCLVLTAHAHEREVIGAIEAGASGYVLKERLGRDVIDAVRRVAGGATVLDDAAARQVVNRLRSGASSERGGALRRLSDQERRILELIAEGRTNRQIAEAMFLAEKTVRNYVSNLLAKLGMERRSEAAAYGARLGERGELGRHG